MFESLKWTSSTGLNYPQILSDFNNNQLSTTAFTDVMNCATEMVEGWMSKPNRKR